LLFFDVAGTFDEVMRIRSLALSESLSTQPR
jgi:hypothetical protein